MIKITASRARDIAIASQGLHARTAPGDPLSVLRLLGCIQLDAINAVRRSHELVLLGRGCEERNSKEFIEHSGPAVFFEYWAHAACLIPLELWGCFTARRRGHWSGPPTDPALREQVLRLARDRGQLTVSDFNQPSGSGWDRRSPHKLAAERLWQTGDLVCVRRHGWKRVYEPVEYAIPTAIREQELDSTEAATRLCEIALRALGVATATDVADYFRIPVAQAVACLDRITDAVPVAVAGWADPAWAHPDALDKPPYVSDAVIPLSPFDSLIWHRPRMLRLFGVEYRLEAYKPAAARECGYFGMPVLAGNELIGRIAIRVKAGAVTVEGIQPAGRARNAELARAIEIAATWGGARAAAATSAVYHPDLTAKGQVRG